MQYIYLETILALDIMHIFQWNEKRAKSQLETLKFFSFTLLMLGFTTTKSESKRRATQRCTNELHFKLCSRKDE